MAPARYMLVVQVPTSDAFDFEGLIALEDLITEALGDLVDGHDVGSGEGNVFVITPHPVEDFARIRDIVIAEIGGEFSAAYRGIESEDYTRLWPQHSRTPFRVA